MLFKTCAPKIAPMPLMTRIGPGIFTWEVSFYLNCHLVACNSLPSWGQLVGKTLAKLAKNCMSIVNQHFWAKQWRTTEFFWVVEKIPSSSTTKGTLHNQLGPTWGKQPHPPDVNHSIMFNPKVTHLRLDPKRGQVSSGVEPANFWFQCNTLTSQATLP